ncbi:NTP transferase domain-containing protein [Rudaeicoccus suwonensis]|uniref:Molybdopterin-guanine dinucleotide biosynthesis protein A n=1 Tax=Rudaeicoccus suwonensis TaxID=657409 RepID=A0A561E3E7_9MICO|nr:NTP transferase domain-containing protein [Rudaeicoccus suwonensis]TWE10138.1 molybdopterin-guanine dinucleotide biosynthesis protein A [Rudaeicoccus suwonensis]
MPTTVVLAGGRSSRFGDDKTRALLRERPLLDQALDGLPETSRIIVVGEPRDTDRTVEWVRESPSFSGPLAALAAALPLITDDEFALIAADMPYAATALPELRLTLRSGPADAVVATDADGRRQPLLAAYRTAAARRGMPTDPTDQPMRALLQQLTVTTLPVEDSAVWDVDTVEDLHAMERRQREADLVTYYDAEATDRRDHPLPEQRIDHRDAFITVLHAEGRERVLEVGTGPGRDAIGFRDAGFQLRGVDLAPASVAVCRTAGLDVQVASALELPFATGSFDAAYTASTLLHVADADLPTALGEIVRVVTPGAPVAIGLWGAPQSRTEHWGGGHYGPARFFALRSDEVLRDAVTKHGRIERFETWPATDGTDLHYQWLVLRTPRD